MTQLYSCKTISIVTDGAPYGRQTAEARTSKSIEAQVAPGVCLGTVVETKGKQWSRVEGEFGSLWVHANHHMADARYNVPKDQRAAGVKGVSAPKALTSAELFALAAEAKKKEQQAMLEKEQELRAMLQEIERLKEEQEMAALEEEELQNEAQEMADDLEVVAS